MRLSIRCGLYARVSSDDQVKQYGLTAQLSILRKYAQDHGYTVPDGFEFVDDGYPGGDLDRPGLTRLREAVRGKVLDVVLVVDTDRLSRNLGHLCLLWEEIEKTGVKIETPAGAMDPSNPESLMKFQILGAVAQFEKAKIRDRTTRGRRQKAMEGHIVGGRTPYGYSYEGREQGQRGRYIVNPEQADVIRKIFAWYAEGISIRQIVTRLNRLGLRPQRAVKWGKSSVHRILTSEVYTGRAYYNRRQRAVPDNPKSASAFRKDKKTSFHERPPSEWIPIEVPSIIHRSLFENAAEKLARNAAALVGRNTGRYLLRGLLRCVCGEKIGGTPMHGIPYYKCRGRDKIAGNKNCKARWLRASNIEEAVWQAVVAVLRDPKFLCRKVGENQDALCLAIADLTREIDRIKGALVDLGRQRARAMQAFLEEDLSELRDSFRAKLVEIQGRTAELKREQARLEIKQAAYASDGSQQDAVLQYCRLVLRGIDRLDGEGRHHLLALLIDEIRVDGRELEIRGILPAGTMVANGPQRADDWTARLR